MQNRTMSLGLLLLLSVGVVGCASAPVDPNAPSACITVDNREGGGAAGRIYLIKDGAERIRLGEVGMGRQLRECIQRNGLVGDYQIAIFAAAADRMDPAMNQNQPPTLASQTFRLNPGDEVIWDVRLNRLRFAGSGGE